VFVWLQMISENSHVAVTMIGEKSL